MQNNKKITTKINSFVGLKTIAMLLIFYWHSPLKNTHLDIGARACELFFIMSGFLVAFNFRKKNIGATWKESAKYFLKKFSQMWPLHILTLLLLIICTKYSLAYGQSILTVICGVTLTQAWTTNNYFLLNGVAWFLSALLFCYFMAPVLNKFTKNKRTAAITFVLVALIRIGLEITQTKFPGLFTSINFHTFPVVRCMEFFLGMLMIPFYETLKEKTSKKSTKRFFLFSLIEILLVSTYIASIFIFNKTLNRGEFVLISCLPIFVLALDSGIISKLLSIKPFQWFASIQFEFYILHQVAFTLLSKTPLRDMPNIPFTICVFLIICLVAFLYNKFLAKKLTNLTQKAINKTFHFLKINIEI